MNKTQLAVLWIGIGIFVLMGLFPPWMVATPQGGNYFATGFGSILGPPYFEPTEGTASKSHWKCRMDVGQLSAQWAMVTVMTAGLIYALRNKKKD